MQVNSHFHKTPVTRSAWFLQKMPLKFLNIFSFLNFSKNLILNFNFKCASVPGNRPNFNGCSGGAFSLSLKACRLNNDQ